MNPAMSVPTVDVRKSIPQAAIDDVIQQIVRGFHPQRIILFGSYAYGAPRPESDVDLLVVMETSVSQSEQSRQILRLLQYNFGLDLLVITPERLKQRLEWGDWFLKEVVERGKVVYESPDV